MMTSRTEDAFSTCDEESTEYAFSTCDKESTEIHIFKYVTEGILETTPCCSIKDRKRNHKTDPLNDCKDENEVRTKAAALQNEGKQICGICVSTFYADK